MKAMHRSIINFAELFYCVPRFHFYFASGRILAQGAWQFAQQRRHALAHLTFVSYATDRVLGSNRQETIYQTDCGRKEGRDEVGSCVAAGDSGHKEDSAVGNRDKVIRESSCEVTRAQKLKFPLELLSEDNPATTIAETPTDAGPGNCWTSPTVEAGHNRRRRSDSVSGRGGARHRKGIAGARDDVLGALRGLNAFAAGLLIAEANDAAKRGAGGECYGGTVPYRMQAGLSILGV